MVSRGWRFTITFRLAPPSGWASIESSIGRILVSVISGASQQTSVAAFLLNNLSRWGLVLKTNNKTIYLFFLGWTGPYSCWLCLLWTTIMDHVPLTGAGVIYNLLCDITSSCKRCTFILWHTRMWECGTMRWWSGLGYLRPDWEFHWFLKRDQHITGRVVREGTFFSSMFWSVAKRGSYTWLRLPAQHCHTMSGGLTYFI